MTNPTSRLWKAFELVLYQALPLDEFPLVIGNSYLKYTLGQINSAIFHR